MKGLIPGCTHFTWKEATFLPQWKRVADDTELTEEVKNNLIALFQKLELVRAYFNASINVHVAFRPPAYNTLIGGARTSYHMTGMAVDFDIVGWSCAKVKAKIIRENMLEAWGMRMEDIVGNWIHLDMGEVKKGRKRNFKP